MRCAICKLDASVGFPIQEFVFYFCFPCFDNYKGMAEELIIDEIRRGI